MFVYPLFYFEWGTHANEDNSMQGKSASIESVCLVRVKKFFWGEFQSFSVVVTFFVCFKFTSLLCCTVGTDVSDG